MPSKQFQAKYANVCSICKKSIDVGQMSLFTSEEKGSIAHFDCYDKAAPSVASSERREGPKPAAGFDAAQPVEVPPDPAIYTYHARALSLDGWKEWGVSTKGRKPTPDELDWVNRVR